MGMGLLRKLNNASFSLFMDRLDDHMHWIVKVWAHTLKASPGTCILWSQTYRLSIGFCIFLV